MIFPAFTWVLLPVSAVLCLVGFYKLSFFSTLAKGLSLAGLSLTVLIVSLIRGDVRLPLAVLCLLGLIYGLFRDGFRAVGEMQSAARRRNLKSQKESDMSIFMLILWWLGFLLIYALLILPLWYRAAEHDGNGALWAWIGAALMTAGLVLEIIANVQMIKAADENPYMPALSGLFRYSRCPGACGEFLFWTGVFVSGIGIYSGLQWLLASLAYLTSLGLVLYRVSREERYALRNFGDLPAYQAYAGRTPLLFPFIPLYTLEPGGLKEKEDDREPGE